MRLRFLIIFDVLIIAAFCGVIWAPLIGNLSGLDQQASTTEKRKLAPRPDPPGDLESLARFPEDFEAYYNDHFGFRNDLIHLHNYIQVKCFSDAGTANVLVGKEGWLFYKQPRTIRYYRNMDPFTEEQLEQWRRGLERRRDQLKLLGIEFAVIFAPNKHTVYPEFLPDFIKPVHEHSRLDQLVDHLKDHTDLFVIDCRPALLEHRDAHRLYHKTDTHWNSRGAWLAYRTVMGRLSELFPALRPLSEDVVKWNEHTEVGKDLALMLGLQEQYEEVVPDIKFKIKLPVRRMEPRTYPGSVTEPRRIITTMRQGTHLPTAVIFRDSFFTQLIRFFERHFRRSVICYDYNIDSAIIKAEKPDLVIFQIVERELMSFNPAKLNLH